MSVTYLSSLFDHIDICDAIGTGINHDTLSCTGWDGWVNVTFGVGVQDGAASVRKGLTAEAHLLGKPASGIFHTSLAWTL